VIDIDPRHKGEASLEKMANDLGPLPKTVTGKTGGGGQHLFFEHPTFAVRKDTAGKVVGTGVDVLSNGCIAIVPPSRHVSGKRYLWAEGKSFGNLKPAQLPPSWLDALRRSSEKSKAVGTAEAGALVDEGRRNTYLMSLAGTLRRNGASPEALSAALIAENNSKCSPPLDVSEVEQNYSPASIGTRRASRSSSELIPLRR
jgi:putative DNA primase/helicase